MPVSQQDRISLSYPETFQDIAKPHAIFTQLRREEPVAWCPEPWNGPGFWAITKYDDIHAISKLPEIFSSDARLGGITLPDPTMIATRQGKTLEQLMQRDSNFEQFEGGRSMIMMDPPEHVQHRRMVAPGFTPQRLDALTPKIRARARDILDALANEREYEFISKVAAELPVQMLAELFGAQQEDRHKLFQWSNIIIGGDDPDIALSREHVNQAFMDLAVYAMGLYAARKENPGDDLITMLVNTRVNGEPMSIADYLSAFILLVVAGNETTRNSISGGTLALSQYPAEKQKLIDDPSLIPRCGRRDHPLGSPRHLHASHRTRGLHGARRDDQKRRQGGAVVHVGQSRRRQMDRPVHVQRDPQPDAPSFIWLRPTPVHRLAPGGNPADGVARGNAGALSGHRSDRRHHEDAHQFPEQHQDDASPRRSAGRLTT